MSEPFIGQIRMFAGNFAPRGNALCDGQLLQISQNNALFSLFGTIYGGDGRTTFALPELRGRLAIHMGSGPGLSSRPIGQKSGAETVSLTGGQVPVHSHVMQGTNEAADTRVPTGALPATAASLTYVDNDASVNLGSPSLANAGGGQSHGNVGPFQCINFIVSLVGLFPSRS